MKTSIDKKRHVFKAISWRLIASSTTFIITWLFTGSVAIGIGIGTIDAIIKMILYYYHERIWYLYINIGIKKRKEENDKR